MFLSKRCRIVLDPKMLFIIPKGSALIRNEIHLSDLFYVVCLYVDLSFTAGILYGVKIIKIGFFENVLVFPRF